MYFETYAEINLKHLSDNIQNIRKHIGDAEVMAVLKADAYGHGAEQVFKTLCEAGIRYFAVANIREALALRAQDSYAGILVFGNIHPENMQAAIQNNISVSVFSKEYWEELKPRLDRKINVHVKLNTGFNRLGFDYSEESVAVIKDVCEHPFVEPQGIYSHLALLDLESDERQFEKFNMFINRLEQEGIYFKIKHISDSISAIKYPWARLDMVRLGAVMYGLRGNHPSYEQVPLKGTLKLYSSISQVREIKKGEGIGYDYTFVAERDMKIATVAFGYGDGYPRNLSNKGYVVVNGKRATIIGLICMDQCIIDVTGTDVSLNDSVLVYDIDGSAEVSLERLATLANTNKNYIIASLTKRVPRVYISKAGGRSSDIST